MVEAKRQLTDLFLESRAEDLGKKVGKPDLIGSFQQGEHPPMSFRLYILENHERQVNIHFEEDTSDFNVPIKRNIVEGIVLDGIGLAIFSGWKTGKDGGINGDA